MNHTVKSKRLQSEDTEKSATATSRHQTGPHQAVCKMAYKEGAHVRTHSSGSPQKNVKFHFEPLC